MHMRNINGSWESLGRLFGALGRVLGGPESILEGLGPPSGDAQILKNRSWVSLGRPLGGQGRPGGAPASIFDVCGVSRRPSGRFFIKDFGEASDLFLLKFWGIRI